MAAKFLLEHFYYGQLVHQGKPKGEARLLAASPGITKEQVTRAIDRVTLPPLIRASVGAWALVRGRDRETPFLLVQSQQGQMGQSIAHYILPGADVLRAIAGNLDVLLALVPEELPVFETVGDPLNRLELMPPLPLTTEQQVEAILDLMTVTENRIDVIERLLGSIVQGTQVIVQGAPPDLRARVGFLAGLLALLPPSARFGVTFTTHSLPTTRIDTQIRFFSDDAPPRDTTVFNWARAGVTGEDHSGDEYSRYVISQLRLDAGLVIERTTRLTQVAGWRLNRGEKLADALGYAAQRLKVDEALRNNQPVNKDEVSRILAEDPTLDEPMRILYARHLLRFSLAMRDMSHADAVAPLLRDNPALEAEVRQQMESALSEGHAALLYETLVAWIANPLGPQGSTWIDLMQRAALSRLRELVDANDIDGINAFVETMQQASITVPFGEIVPQIVTLLRPHSARDQRLAENLFLLAVKFLEVESFRTLMDDAAFRGQLPPNINRAWTYISTGTMYTTPSESLVQAAAGFGPQWEPVVLLRFAELAAAGRKFGLLETPTLAVLAALALDPDQRQYADRLLWVAGTLDDSVLATLDGDGPLHLLQIRLALGDYKELAYQMIEHAKLLYPGDRLVEYLRMAERLFAETPIAPEDVPHALDALHDAGIINAPHIMAAIGALAKQEGTEALDVVAARAGATLAGDRNLLDVIPPQSLVNLLDYHLRRSDVENTIRAASLVPVAAAHQGKGSVKALAYMYNRMDWDARTRVAALQMLRSYIRETDDDTAQRAATYFGRELGDTVRRALYTTYTLKRFMGDTPLLLYAHRLHNAVDFLSQSVALYAGGEPPTIAELFGGLDGLTSDLPPDERAEQARNLLLFGRALVLAGEQYRSVRPRDENKYIEAIVSANTDPRCALDVFRALGGYFARGKRSDPTPERGARHHPFGGYETASAFRNGLLDMLSLIDDALRAFPPDKKIRLPAADLRAEIESLWSAVDEAQQKAAVLEMAQDFQAMASLVARIEHDGDARALEDNNLGKKIDTGKQRPRSVLEMLRFAYSVYMG